MKKSRVLIVDALNAFFRGYIVDPRCRQTVSPLAAFEVFCESCKPPSETQKPDKIVIAWDGQGGS